MTGTVSLALDNRSLILEINIIICNKILKLIKLQSSKFHSLINLVFTNIASPSGRPCCPAMLSFLPSVCLSVYLFVYLSFPPVLSHLLSNLSLPIFSPGYVFHVCLYIFVFPHVARIVDLMTLTLYIWPPPTTGPGVSKSTHSLHIVYMISSIQLPVM